MPLVQHRYSGMDVEEVTRYTINRKDIIHLKNLYNLMHEWLIEHNYAPRDDKFFPEKYVTHKVLPAGLDCWWRWRPSRYPLGEETKKRYRFDLNIDCHVLTLKDVEAVIGGKKYKAQQGEVEVQVNAVFVFDPDKTFEKSAFREIKTLLYGRVWKQQYEMLKEELRREAFQFRDAIATFMTIETYLPTKEWPGYWPKRIPE